MSRVVMFVFNDCRNDARVLREAASLTLAGHAVTIMARLGPAPARPSTSGLPERERRDGFEIVRVAVPQGWRFWWTWIRYPWRMGTWWRGRLRRALRRPAGFLEAVALLLAGLLTLVWMVVVWPFDRWGRRRPVPPGGTDVEWLVRWRWGTLGWAQAAADAAPVADVYHGHDLSGLEAAGRAMRRHGGQLVYDSHEIFLESSSVALRPRWIKRILSRSERRWIRASAALVTVNQSLADDLGRSYRPRRSVIVHNCPARWQVPDPRPDLIRAATGIPGDEVIALYHGGFSPHRGLEELAASLLEPGMDGIHAVYLGYGSQREMLDGMAADPRYGGRVHVLDAVSPDALLPWVAAADVAVMAIQPSTRNHRLSTPNKLFEALAAGVPVVVSDFPEMHRIVLDDPDGPLGLACRPDDVADVARAIREIAALDQSSIRDLRARCLRAAHLRWNWETEVARLIQLYREIGALG